MQWCVIGREAPTSTPCPTRASAAVPRGAPATATAFKGIAARCAAFAPDPISTSTRKSGRACTARWSHGSRTTATITTTTTIIIISSSSITIVITIISSGAKAERRYSRYSRYARAAPRAASWVTTLTRPPLPGQPNFFAAVWRYGGSLLVPFCFAVAYWATRLILWHPQPWTSNTRKRIKRFGGVLYASGALGVVKQFVNFYQVLRMTQWNHVTRSTGTAGTLSSTAASPRRLRRNAAYVAGAAPARRRVPRAAPRVVALPRLV